MTLRDFIYSTPSGISQKLTSGASRVNVVLQRSGSRPEKCVRGERGNQETQDDSYSGREIELGRHERQFHGIEVELERKYEEESHTKFQEEEGKLGFDIIALYDKL
jgi:hypothetical protein